MAIAGADGELSEEEIQWFIDEQELSYIDATECVKAVHEINRSGAWKTIDIQKTLSAIQDQIKEYHKDEKAAVNKAAKTLGIKPDVVTNLESIAELEDTVERLRYSLLRAKR